MKIFKFGGASVKDAKGIQNIASILQQYGAKDTLVVVSAMGKTTNALEGIIESYFDQKSYEQDLLKIQQNHLDVVNELFEDKQAITQQIELIFNDLTAFFRRNKSPDYNYVYDQVVGYGELTSTTIISAYLNKIGLQNQWLDARDYIKTNTDYREAIVDWSLTQEKLQKLKTNQLYISQGFIGSDGNYFTTTLGREGSDYSAAIFAYCLNAESVTIWKDVPGVLNADPRYFKDAQLLNSISYTEAIELAYFGATVIHPKTLQPLQRKKIPLFVKSFVQPSENGTIIKEGEPINPMLPCFILIKDLEYLQISAKDFSFITEEIMATIFGLLNQHHIKVRLMQTSAMSLSLCLADKYNKVDALLNQIKETYNTIRHKNVSLYTVRHYNQEAEAQVTANQEILMEQISEGTLQIVTT